MLSSFQVIFSYFDFLLYSIGHYDKLEVQVKSL